MLTQAIMETEPQGTTTCLITILPTATIHTATTVHIWEDLTEGIKSIDF